MNNWLSEFGEAIAKHSVNYMTSMPGWFEAFALNRLAM
jgi:hypothetical protein